MSIMQLMIWLLLLLFIILCSLTTIGLTATINCATSLDENTQVVLNSRDSHVVDNTNVTTSVLLEGWSLFDIDRFNFNTTFTGTFSWGQSTGVGSCSPLFSICNPFGQMDPTMQGEDNWVVSPFFSTGGESIHVQLTCNNPGATVPSNLDCRTATSVMYYETDVLAPIQIDTLSYFTPAIVESSAPEIISASFTKSKLGFYLAFNNSGLCTNILETLITYFQCSATNGYNNIGSLPNTSAPNVTHQPLQIQFTCPTTASSTGLTAECYANGSWVIIDSIACGCNAGYRVVSQSSAYSCEACPIDTYKQSIGNSNCAVCPANSHTNGVTGETGCVCRDGFFRGVGESVVMSCGTNPSNVGNITTTPDPDFISTIETTLTTNYTDTLSISMNYIANLSFDQTLNIILTVCAITLIIILVIVLTIISFYCFFSHISNKSYSSVLSTEEFHPATKKTYNPKISNTQHSGPISLISNKSYSRIHSTEEFNKTEKKTYHPKIFKIQHPDPITKNSSTTLVKTINPIDITIGNLLKSRQFHEIREGVFNRNGKLLSIAIKSLKSNVPVGSKEDFFREAFIMEQFSNANVLFLYGVLDNPKTIITPFMNNGSLDVYLRKNIQLKCIQLDEICLGVASGMKYLSGIGFVHGDLAARNVLLDSDMTPKIAGFGLSREMKELVQTEKSENARWKAPEAIISKEFSTFSDVWSFGILLWEVMSFGAMPYEGINKATILFKISEGYRLPKPDSCEISVYYLMLSCWENDPMNRPTFINLETSLSALVVSWKISHITRFPSIRDRKSPSRLSISSENPLDCTSIEQWLSSLKMERYLNNFRSYGYTSMTSVWHMTEEDLISMKVVNHYDCTRIMDSVHRANNDLNCGYSM